MVSMAILAISKYQVTDKDTGITVRQHSLVVTAKKAFWQLKPPIPQYHATYDVSVVLRYIKSLGENENLSNKQLSEYQLSWWRSLLCLGTAWFHT